MSGVRVLVGTRKGAFILTVRWQAPEVGRQRPALRRLGDLSRQGLAASIRTGCMPRSRAVGSGN